MSEQQNNQIEIIDDENVRECGVCYENKRWSCDMGDFIQGCNCDHMVCVDCSVKISRCPFCRKAWQDMRDRVVYQVRADDEFVQDNEGDWQFTTEDFARAIYGNVMDDIEAGDRNDIRHLRITRTPELDEDDWNELFEDEVPYPEVITIDEWHRDEEPPCDRCGNPSTAGLINDEFLCIECREDDE